MNRNAFSADFVPRIYVASLADYNAGHLHGRWIDAHHGEEHIRDEIAAMLQESSEPMAEEWAVHDYEGFSGVRISEFSNAADIARIVSFIDEYGTVFAALIEHFGGAESGLEEAEQWMKNGYYGVFSSVSDYAEYFINDCYSDAFEALPEFIRNRIDYDGIADDLELCGDIFAIEVDGEVHIFAGQL